MLERTAATVDEVPNWLRRLLNIQPMKGTSKEFGMPTPLRVIIDRICCERVSLGEEIGPDTMADLLQALFGLSATSP